jgi:metal-dependent amidase/aminoacylase/carboxypeptidase family protein
MAVINSIADREQDMKAWRHLLHQHPETSYEEVWTSDFIAANYNHLASRLIVVWGKLALSGFCAALATARRQSDCGLIWTRCQCRK